MNELLTAEELAALQSERGCLFDDCRLPTEGVGNANDGVIIKHFVTPEEIKADMAINPLDVTNAMIQLSSHYARYTYLLAKARLQKDDAERRLELLEAKLDKAIRDDAAKKGEKITEPAIAAKIRRQTSYIKASMTFNEARAVFQVMEGLVSAMDKKHSMLVQLNKNQNTDYDRSTALVPSEESISNAKEQWLAARKRANSR